MLLAIVSGADVHLRYTVQEALGYGDRKCPYPVKLNGLPFLFNEVCGLSEEFQALLKPGMQIELTGRGAAAGLFPREVMIVPSDMEPDAAGRP